MKLLALTVNKNDSTSFYRANGVFHDLQQKMPNLQITSIDFSAMHEMSWATLTMFDIVFMQRPYQPVALKLAGYCREMNIPVWVDYDDNLLEIPVDNRAYPIYSNPDTQKTIRSILAMANAVTVSTKPLGEAYSFFSKNITVIPNALNTRLLNYRPAKIKTKKTALWRGSDTHQLDILLYTDEIYNAAERHPDWNFHFFGFNPWMLPPLPNRTYSPPTDPVLYFKQLSQLAPRFIYVPLANNKFNMAKSNIAYIEGTWSGAITLAPDWEHWRNPGTLTYNSNETFATNIERILSETVNFEKYNNQAWQFITDTLTLTTVNTQRSLLISRLIDETR